MNKLNEKICNHMIKNGSYGGYKEWQQHVKSAAEEHLTKAQANKIKFQYSTEIPCLINEEVAASRVTIKRWRNSPVCPARVCPALAMMTAPLASSSRRRRVRAAAVCHRLWQRTRWDFLAQEEEVSRPVCNGVTFSSAMGGLTAVRGRDPGLVV